ncbi:MAG: BMP family ABC transporter substrate-binding protein, partial [Ktedonobacterales bacterium]
MLSSRWRYLSISILLLLLVPAMAACGTSTTGGGGSATPKPGANVKVGLVTDIDGLNDKGFNHLAFVGLQKAISDLGIKGDVKESHADTDYVTNLTGFAT